MNPILAYGGAAEMGLPLWLEWLAIGLAAAVILTAFLSARSAATAGDAMPHLFRRRVTDVFYKISIHDDSAGDKPAPPQLGYLRSLSELRTTLVSRARWQRGSRLTLTVDQPENTGAEPPDLHGIVAGSRPLRGDDDWYVTRVMLDHDKDALRRTDALIATIGPR